MYSLLLQLITFASLAVIVYLMARAVPRVRDEEIGRTHAAGRFDALLSKLPLEKVDAWLNAFFEKTLRKTKVVVLKFDNLLNQYLNRVKRASGKQSERRREREDLFRNDEQNSGNGNGEHQ